MTSSSIPEFITAPSWSLWSASSSGWLPVLATPPPDADVLTQARYLLMPAIAMAIVYFGYIARMTRAGTIEVLQSDYTRTATMKGLTTSQTMRRTSCAMPCLPTVAVIAVQIGYLFGGIIAVEKIFNYNGMGATMLFAAQRKDLPMLTAGVIVIGIVYMLATLRPTSSSAWMNPRIRLDASTDGRCHHQPDPAAARADGRSGSVRAGAGATRDAAPAPSPAGVHHRQHHHHRLDHLRRPRRPDHAVRSVQLLLDRAPAAEPGALDGHGPDRPGRPVAGDGRLPRRADRRARWQPCSGSPQARSWV